MTIFYIVLIALAGSIILINLMLLVFALIIRKKAFGSRCDKNPLLKYFSAEDFGLTQTVLNIAEPKKTQYVRAVLYKKEDIEQRKELVIFCHGMGPGHVAYTTEIAYFCNLGYPVLAPDYFGCNLSDGGSIKNFANGTNSVAAAVLYARQNLTRYGKIYLVGHSWGGYSALTAAEKTEVDKVVAISAPDRPELAVYQVVKSVFPNFLAKMLYPYIILVCGGASAAESANRLTVPVLLVQGGEDKTIPPANSVYHRAEGKNIKKLLSAGKGHNPYNTVAAEKKLAELSAALQIPQKADGQFFKKFDFSAATEEDKAVMEEIARFLA